MSNHMLNKYVTSHIEFPLGEVKTKAILVSAIRDYFERVIDGIDLSSIANHLINLNKAPDKYSWSSSTLSILSDLIDFDYAIEKKDAKQIKQMEEKMKKFIS